jgi:hypothetical protein
MVCSHGICCASDQAACGGACYNVNNDAKHCGTGCAVCPLGILCVNGRCAL